MAQADYCQPIKASELVRVRATESWRFTADGVFLGPVVIEYGFRRWVSPEVVLKTLGPIPAKTADWLSSRVAWFPLWPMVADDDIQALSILLPSPQREIAERLSAVIRSEQGFPYEFVSSLRTISDVKADRAASTVKPSGSIYVVRSRLTGMLKIGHSRNVTNRIKGLTTQGGSELETLLVRSGSFEHEQAVHAMFAKHRKLGEWFEDCTEIRQWVTKGGPLSRLAPRTPEPQRPTPQAPMLPVVTCYVPPDVVQPAPELPLTSIARMYRDQCEFLGREIDVNTEKLRTSFIAIAEANPDIPSLQAMAAQLRGMVQT